MITADKVKNQIQSLINTANGKTGNNDVDLTSAVGSLVEGFGGGVDLIPYLYEANFKSAIFPDDSEIVINATGIKSQAGALSFYQVKGCKKIKIITGDETIEANMGSVFQGIVGFREDKLTEVDLSNTKIIWTSAVNAFQHRYNLKVVKGELEFTSTANLINIFGNCTSLEEVRFKKGTLHTNLPLAHSSLLSDSSIQSIIDGLADLTGGTAQVLTVHKDIRAKIESNPQQLATIIDKNWTLASA